MSWRLGGLVERDTDLLRDFCFMLLSVYFKPSLHYWNGKGFVIKLACFVFFNFVFS